MSPVPVMASLSAPWIQNQISPLRGLHEAFGWGRMHQLGGATKSGELMALNRPLPARTKTYVMGEETAIE